MKKRALIKFLTFIFILMILSGCFKGEQSNANSINNLNNEDDYGENLNEENNNSDEDPSNDSEGAEQETARRDLYLFDVNGMVVAQSFELPLPESKEVASQVLQYLVKEGPVTELLPNGFQAVLPEGTEILGVNLQEDGSIIVDFSEEFKNYQAENESKILQAITYTLTQFDSIDRVYIRINGHPLTEMPIDGTPIEEGYSRAKGINYYFSDSLDLLNSETVTFYYPAEYNDRRYYVPITQHISISDNDFYTSVLRALIEGPGYEPNVIHVFNTETSLLEPPELENGILQLVFNDRILLDYEQAIISDEVMETLARTFTGFQAVDAILVKVENTNVIMNEKGEEYIEPVTLENLFEGEKL